MKQLELYRNVKLTETEFDAINQIATNEGRSFASQAGIFIRQGLKDYRRKQK